MKISDTKSLGAALRRLRKEQGITQEQLAATIGVGIRFIRELEQGKESCHLGKTLLLIQGLGAQLVLDTGDEP